MWRALFIDPKVSRGTASCPHTSKEYQHLARESEIQFHGVKLNKWQCGSLERKLSDCKNVVKEIEDSLQSSEREQCVPVLRELDRIVAGAEALIHKCCTQEWLQAAIEVAGNKELFVKYHAELEWYVALLRVASAVQDSHEQMTQLRSFDWDSLVDGIRSSIKVAALKDRKEFLKLLEERISTSTNLAEHNLSKLLLRKFDGRSPGNSVEKVLFVEKPQELGIQEAGCHIGSGGFAEVYRNEWMGKTYCRKVLARDIGRCSFKNETKMLTALIHPHIVPMVCSFVDPEGKDCILMELLSEDLEKLIKRETEAAPGAPPFELSKALDVMLQIGDGLNFLHQNKTSHRDLKSSNVLVTSEPDLVVKICDLGLAKLKETSASQSVQTPNTGTTPWRAPELFGTAGCWADPRKVDVWGFALICAHILTGKPPFESVRNCKIYKEITTRGKRPDLPSTVPGALVKLLQACWERDPSKRPLFPYICRELRLLKGIVFLGGDLPECCSMPPQPPPQSTEACRPFLNIADSRSPTTSAATRFLVVGKLDAESTKLVQKVCQSNTGNRTMGIEEYKHPSLPLYLYDSRGLDDQKQMDVLHKFVKARNNSWTIQSLMRRWHVALRPWYRGDEDPLSSDRIHGIWFVYAISDTPGIEWAQLMQRINKYNLPLQIILTHFPGQDPDGDKLKENILDNRCYLQCPQKEQIITFDLDTSHNDMPSADSLASEGREYLQNPDDNGIWYASQVTRTTLEIKLAAQIISELRMELGRSGFYISQAQFRDASKSHSYTQSAFFIFKFCCRLWDVPGSLQVALAKKVVGMGSFADRDCDGNFKLKPGTFLLFSLKVAAVILFMKIVQDPTGTTIVDAGYEANIDECFRYLDTKLGDLFDSCALEQHVPKLYFSKKHASKKLGSYLETVLENCFQAIRADNDVRARMTIRCPSGSLCSSSSSFSEASRFFTSSEQSSSPPSRPSVSPTPSFGRSILEMMLIFPMVFLLISSSFLTFI